MAALFSAMKGSSPQTLQKPSSTIHHSRRIFSSRPSPDSHPDVPHLRRRACPPLVPSELLLLLPLLLLVAPALRTCQIPKMNFPPSSPLLSSVHL
uniref:Uncharacterized protein n=1 Tax=Knipowitschia caucasica TaxID=637954 RepID=A0AAV2KYG8_KNICA